eukprot:TRINITY_DN4013_c0_g1_i23.p1 TRINITY_DN4013_c0_g1~~TRINITY_DN4013_c0_g1_i23.p1  ORF type:complete len:121 (-),score=1.94 TRINITY_DN4013_c0_g1_i23:389-751(-)
MLGACGVTWCSANFDDMGRRSLLVLDDAVLVDTNAMNSLKEFISSRTIPGIHLQHGRHKANKRNAIPSLITQLPDQTLLESRMLSLLEHDDIDLVSVLLAAPVITIHNRRPISKKMIIIK